MFIKAETLRLAKKENVMRLIKYLEIVSHQRKYEDILEELHIHLNWG